MTAPYSAQQIQLGFLMESVFGTPAAANAALKTLYPQGNAQMQDNFDYQVLRRTSGKITPDKRDIYVNPNMAPTLTTNKIFDRNMLPELLALVMQATATGGPDYEIKYTSAPVDFAADAGFFATLVERVPADSYDRQMASAIINELTISCRTGQDQGLLSMVASFIGAVPILKNINQTGTWSEPAEERLSINDIKTATLFGADLLAAGFNGFDMTFGNGATAEGWNVDKFGQFFLSPIGSCTISQNVSQTAFLALLPNWEAGTNGVLNIVFNTAASDGYLEFTHNVVISEQPPESGEEVYVGDITLDMVDSAAASDMAVVDYNLT